MNSGKKLLPAIVVLVLLNLVSHAQVKPEDRIKGIWLTEEKDGKIEIFRTGNTYTGRLVWGNSVLDRNGNPKRDVNNPDPKLKSRTLQGMVMLTGLVYEDGKWQEGKIYNGLTGKSYSVVITLKGNTLFLRGYIGLRCWGRLLFGSG